MLSSVDVFQCYIRMCNADKLFTTQTMIDLYILDILKYMDNKGFRPFSDVKGEGNYPQEYDCKCINKFRVKYNLEPYEYVDGVGIVKELVVKTRLPINKERLNRISERGIERYMNSKLGVDNG